MVFMTNVYLYTFQHYSQPKLALNWKDLKNSWK